MNPSISAWWVASSSVSCDDAVDGDAGVAGDLGTQFVGRAPGGGGDVGLGASFELGHLDVEAGPTVGEQRLGLGFGLGVEAGALGLDVALGLADVGRPRPRP